MRTNEIAGITLIALIITIIVLLILAGITINALTGSESAPAKANEAEQKNDIGIAKDQIGLIATNSKLLAYESSYVGNGVSSTEAATTVGQAVIDAVLPYNEKTIGKASIMVKQLSNNDGEITILTRDFEVTGTITYQDGILTWGEIVDNIPGIEITNVPDSLNKGSFVELGIKRNNVTGDITWTSSTPTVATVEQNTGKVTGVKAGTATITAMVTGTDYTAQCTIMVLTSKADIVNAKIGTEILYPRAREATATTEALAGFSAYYTGTWKIFYANNEEMFIIPSNVISASTIGFYPNGIPSTDTNGSKSIANSEYGYKYNNLWLRQCGQITSIGAVDNAVKKNQNKHNAVAYLCNTSNWDGFVAKTTGANPTNLIPGSYAVGGPTYELFIDAWNAAKNTDINPNNGNDVYGYSTTLDTNNSITELDGNGVFRPSTNVSYCLASPYKYSTLKDDILYFMCDYGCLGSGNFDNPSLGARPLVSIPMTNVLVDNEGNVSINFNS